MNLGKLNISKKLTACFFGAGILILAATQIASQIIARNALLDEATNRLDGLRAVKHAEIVRYFEGIRDQVLTFSEDRMVVDAMMRLPALRHQFLSQNNLEGQDISTL